MNHTWRHPYLGLCQGLHGRALALRHRSGKGRALGEPADITAQITPEHHWARAQRHHHRQAGADHRRALRAAGLPQMPTDNPNLALALPAAGVKYLAATRPASRPPGAVGPALTVPRHPMNIYYNVATRAEEVDEYNWIYTRAERRQRDLRANPASTCITPLPGASGVRQLHRAGRGRHRVRPRRVRPTRARTTRTSPTSPRTRCCTRCSTRSWRATGRYFAANTPLVNPRMAEVAEQLRRAEAWRAAVARRPVEAFVADGQGHDHQPRHSEAGHPGGHAGRHRMS